jgi:small subunit ribosomal protein S4
VNGRKVDIPSQVLKTGDVVEVRSGSREITTVLSALDAVDSRGVPAWLELDRTAFRGTVKAVPTKQDAAVPVNEQLVVELYSR